VEEGAGKDGVSGHWKSKLKFLGTKLNYASQRKMPGADILKALKEDQTSAENRKRCEPEAWEKKRM